MENPTEISDKGAMVPRATGPRWMKVLLFLSLAANLAIVGIAVGVLLHGRAGGFHGGTMRDPSFGAFDQALSRADRAALRREFISHSGPLMQNRAATRSMLTELMNALQTDPFDAATLESVMHRLNENGRDRLELGQKLLTNRLLSMPPEDRARFAGRLESILSHGRDDSDAPAAEN